MEDKKTINWSLQGLWNEQLTFGREQRELKVRDRMWASELGKDFYERYLKMNAVKPDFDYEERILRKFEAGNFFERIVGFVLMSAGILMHDNKWHEIPADEDHLSISVKPDFIAGGKPDWRKAEEEISRNMLFELMPNLKRIAKSLVEHFSKEYPDGLNPLVFEIKSVNSQVFWAKKDYLNQAYPHHLLQTFAEMKATGLPEGRILYISKDDLTVAEFALFLNSEALNEAYEKDVRSMTKYIREGIEPPKPDDFVFDEHRKLKFQHNKKKYTLQGCYVPNWQISWSNYITKITGIKGKTQKEVCEKWERKIKPIISSKNDELKNRFKENLK
jgi:hypothetical protein